MAEFASPEETQRALEKLLDIQSTDPNGLSGILNKYGNPFMSWPLLKEPTEAFLRFFESPGTQPEAEPGSQQNINPKLREMIDVFDKEIAEAKAGRVKAETIAKKYVEALIKRAKEARVPLTETQVVALQEPEGSPLSPERVSEIISTTIQRPVPPEQKEVFLHALEMSAVRRPKKNVVELIPRAFAMTRVARALTLPKRVPSLGAPPRRTGALQQLGAIVGHPEKLPAGIMQQLVDRLGVGFVASEWFTKFRLNANTMLGEQKGPSKIIGRVTSLFADIGTAVFRGPLDENVIACIETSRLIATQGVQVADFSGYRNVLFDRLPQIVPSGVPHATKIGAPVGVTAIIGANVQAVRGHVMEQLKRLAVVAIKETSHLFTRTTGGFMGLLGGGNDFLKSLRSTPRTKKKVNVWLVIGIIAFLFFVFILPMLNQSTIDTSLATNVGKGGELLATDSGTLSCAKTDGAYISQRNPLWTNYTCEDARPSEPACYEPNTSCTIGDSGCGSASTTMILKAFGLSADVKTVWNNQHATGGYAYYYCSPGDNSCTDSCGASLQSVLGRLGDAGLSTSALGAGGWSEAEKIFAGCGLVLALGHNRYKDPITGNVSLTGHYIVIEGTHVEGGQVMSVDALDPLSSSPTTEKIVGPDATFLVDVGMWGVVK